MENMFFDFRRKNSELSARWQQLSQRISAFNAELNDARKLVSRTAQAFALLSKVTDEKSREIRTAVEVKELTAVAERAKNLNSDPQNPAVSVSDTESETARILNDILAELRQMRKETQTPAENNNGKQSQNSARTGQLEGPTGENSSSERFAERFLKVTDRVQTITRTAAEALDELTSRQISRLDTVIEKQEENVSRAKKLAETGNVELLKLEEERLEKLQREREKFVRNQQALAVIELVVNSSIAIAKAAAQGGIAAPITIAATLIALAAGLAQARAQAQAAVPSAEKGGVAGTGSLKNGSLNVSAGGVLTGDRHHTGGILIEAEDGERIFDRNTSRTYHAAFEKLIRYRPAPQRLEQMISQTSNPVPRLPEMMINPNRLQRHTSPGRESSENYSHVFKKIQTELESIRLAIIKQERLSVSISDKGIYAVTQRLEDRNRRKEKLRTGK